MSRMAKSMALKHASESDAELVYNIKHGAYAAYTIEAYGTWDEEFQRRYTRQNLPHTRLIVAHDTVVGWIAAAQKEHEVEILDIHVLPPHQRNGYGRAAISGIIRDASVERKAVSMGVLKNNPCRALYERLGFVATGETRTHVLMKMPSHSPDPTPVSVAAAAGQPPRQP